LDQSAVPMFLFVVHSHVCPIGGDGCCGRGPVDSRHARGLQVSLRRGRSTPRGLGAPVLMLQRSGEVEIAPDRAHGSGALMTSWGLGEAEAIALSLGQSGS
jgi:hypothetical protein